MKKIISVLCGELPIIDNNGYPLPSTFLCARSITGITI
jgi:hypothetical protein